MGRRFFVRHESELVGPGARSPAAGTRVLVALSDIARADDVARAMESADLMPAVSFSAGAAVRSLRRDSFDLVVLDPELLAEVVAQLSVGLPATRAPRPDARSWGPLELDMRTRSATWHRRPVHLTPLEFRILETLATAEGAVVTVEELGRLIWGTDFACDEPVFAHVRRIRRKIEHDPSRPEFLITVRGQGLRLAGRGVTGYKRWRCALSGALKDASPFA